jgi:hypothetical protein
VRLDERAEGARIATASAVQQPPVKSPERRYGRFRHDQAGRPSPASVVPGGFLAESSVLKVMRVWPCRHKPAFHVGSPSQGG